LRLMLLPVAAKKPQVNQFARIFVINFLHQVSYTHLDAQFLAQFTNQTFFKCFGRLPLASRKLPETAEMNIIMPLGDEEFSVSKNESSGNFDSLHDR
jgi:hypothetical protein